MDRLFEFETIVTATFTAKAANNLSRPTGVDESGLRLYTYFHDDAPNFFYGGTGWADWGVFDRDPDDGSPITVVPSEPKTWAKFKSLLSTGGSRVLGFANSSADKKNVRDLLEQKDKYLHIWYLPEGSNAKPQEMVAQIGNYRSYYGGRQAKLLYVADDPGDSVDFVVGAGSRLGNKTPVYIWVEDSAPASGSQTVIKKLWAEVESGIATDQLGEAEPVSTFIFRYRSNFFTVGRVFTDEHDRDWQITGVVEIGRREFMQVIAKPYIPSSD